jgi:DNA-binding GntR family transcriptional regulator
MEWRIILRYGPGLSGQRERTLATNVAEDRSLQDLVLDPTANVAFQVREYLQQQIVTNVFTPGMRLSENELSGSLGISRQPVREALIRLSEHHLVRALPQRGTEVTRISLSFAISGRFIREAVESAIVERVASRAADLDFALLQDLLAAQRRAAGADDHRRFLMLDDQFHRELARLAGQEMAWRTLGSIKLHMDRVRHLSLEDATSILRLVEQHEAVFEAMRKGDTANAVAAMKAHLGAMLVYLPTLADRLPHFFAD